MQLEEEIVLTFEGCAPEDVSVGRLPGWLLRTGGRGRKRRRKGREEGGILPDGGNRRCTKVAFKLRVLCATIIGLASTARCRVCRNRLSHDAAVCSSLAQCAIRAATWHCSVVSGVTL